MDLFKYMELKSAMETLEFLLDHRKSKNAFLLLREKEIEALKSVLNAAGKQEPDWPMPKDAENGIWQCWGCGYVVKKDERPKYCPGCGQAMDWSITEEE